MLSPDGLSTIERTTAVRLTPGIFTAHDIQLQPASLLATRPSLLRHSIDKMPALLESFTA